MKMQQIYQVGNSTVVTLPPHILKDMGWKKGQKVNIKSSNEGVLIVSEKKAPYSAPITDEFDAWSKTFFEEDGALMDELAHR